MAADVLQVLEPATEAVLEEVPRAGVEDADDAVARATAAFPAWRDLAPADRSKLLFALTARLEEEHEALAVLEARNAGKPISDARGEIEMVVDTFRYYAGMPERILGDTIPVAGGRVEHPAHPRPVGVGLAAGQRREVGEEPQVARHARQVHRPALADRLADGARLELRELLL